MYPMSNENNTGAADLTFIPSAEELARLAEWDRQDEETAPPSGPVAYDYSDEKARALAIAATYTEEEMDALAASHDAARGDEEARCESE